MFPWFTFTQIRDIAHFKSVILLSDSRVIINDFMLQIIHTTVFLVVPLNSENSSINISYIEFNYTLPDNR
jgi:hypothetical protein